nr:hypothetical protein [Tanacetum cinerariifolium]
MRRIGKGFSGVDTPLFDGMLVPQQAQDVEDDVEDEDDVNEITQAIEITKLKQRVKRLEKKRQFKSSGLKRLRKVGTAQRVESSADTVMDDQEDASKQGGEIAELDADKDITLEEVDAEVTMDANVQGRLEESQAKVYHLDLEHAEKVLTMQDTDEAEPVKVEEASAPRRRRGVIIQDLEEAAIALVIMQSEEKKGVIIQDLEEAAIALVIMQSEVKSNDKGKGILVEEPKPLKRQAQIEQNEAFARELEAELNANINWNDVVDKVNRKERQENTVMRYQVLKRKPVTEAQARKNMMVYLKNMAGFKMDFFRGMTYIEIRPIFEKHYNSIQAFLEKGEKEIKEEGSKRKSESSKQRAAKKQRIHKYVEELKTHLHIVVHDDDDVYTEATPLALKVLVVDYQIHHEHNKPFYKIIRADETHQLFLSFINLSKNFDREDLEMLWRLVQERFQSLEPKNFLDDFLLNTLKTMFKRPNVEGSIWRYQRGRYGLAKVKSWKLFESCGVHIITFTTTQMILLVERKYPLTRFTLEQMHNNVRMEVEEESEMSLELLRLVRRQLQEGYKSE